MSQPSKKIDVAEILQTDRDLTPEELEALQNVADSAWRDLRSQLHDRARNVYAVASPGAFAECVQQHMGDEDRVDMVKADAYHCPECGRHLKDRRTPVAASVLVERRRLRDLYLLIDRTPEGPARERATRRFIAALGNA